MAYLITVIINIIINRIIIIIIIIIITIISIITIIIIIIIIILISKVMQLWDALSYTNSSVLVFGATNRPDDLDPAIQRRFDRSFQINPPDEPARSEIIDTFINTNNYNITRDAYFNVHYVAKRTDGYSASDLNALYNAAVQLSMRRYLNQPNNYDALDSNNSNNTSADDDNHDVVGPLITTKVIYFNNEF